MVVGTQLSYRLLRCVYRRRANGGLDFLPQNAPGLPITARIADREAEASSIDEVLAGLLYDVTRELTRGDYRGWAVFGAVDADKNNPLLDRYNNSGDEWTKGGNWHGVDIYLEKEIEFEEEEEE